MGDILTPNLETSDTTTYLHFYAENGCELNDKCFVRMGHYEVKKSRINGRSLQPTHIREYN